MGESTAYRFEPLHPAVVRELEAEAELQNVPFEQFMVEAVTMGMYLAKFAQRSRAMGGLPSICWMVSAGISVRMPLNFKILTEPHVVPEMPGIIDPFQDDEGVAIVISREDYDTFATLAMELEVLPADFISTGIFARAVWDPELDGGGVIFDDGLGNQHILDLD